MGSAGAGVLGVQGREGREVAGAASYRPWELLLMALAFTLNKWAVSEE